jgi:hypothetical protein
MRERRDGMIHHRRESIPQPGERGVDFCRGLDSGQGPKVRHNLYEFGVCDLRHGALLRLT